MEYVHDFRSSLAASHASADEPFWERIYRAMFGPDLVACVNTVNALDWQRRGVDRLVILQDGTQYNIDEKRRAWADTSDVMLEYMHQCDDGSIAPGWVAKPNRAHHFVCYAWVPRQLALLLAWPLLRRAWRRYGEEWRGQYPTYSARNRSYCSLNVAVPTSVLLETLQRASWVNWAVQPARREDC
jgi:hypothetical protein